MVALLGTVATGLLFVTGGVVAQLMNVGFGLWWGEALVFFGVPYLALRLSGYAPLPTAGLRGFWAGGAAIGLFAGLLNFFALVVPLQVFSQKLAPKWLLELVDNSFLFKQQTPLELALVIGGVCLAAPFCEEFCFRGMMQRGAERAFGPVRALIVTSVVFSAFHMDPVGFLARVELGLLFGWLFWRSGSVWPGIFAHLANNTISVVLYFLSKGQDDDEMPWWIPPLFMLVGVPLLYALLHFGQKTLEAPPAKAEDTPRPVGSVARPIFTWMAIAAVSLGGLVLVDPRGVMLNGIDTVLPLKEPKAEDGAAARQQWDALIELRKEARRGSANTDEYLAARRAAVTDRKSAKKKLEFQF